MYKPTKEYYFSIIHFPTKQPCYTEYNMYLTL